MIQVADGVVRRNAFGPFVRTGASAAANAFRPFMRKTRAVSRTVGD